MNAKRNFYTIFFIMTLRQTATDIITVLINLS